MVRKFDSNEVLQQLFNDDFGISDEDSNDDEGEGIFAYICLKAAF